MFPIIVNFMEENKKREQQNSNNNMAIKKATTPINNTNYASMFIYLMKTNIKSTMNRALKFFSF